MRDTFATVGSSFERAIQLAQTAGSGGLVELDIDGVRDSGRNTVDAADNAATSSSRVESATGYREAFSQYPLAQQVAGEFAAVSDVFIDTLRALKGEVADFGEAVIAAANAYDEADERTQQVFTSMAQQVESGATTPTQEAYDASRARNETDLAHVDDISVDESMLSEDARTELGEHASDGSQDQTTTESESTSAGAYGG